MCIRDRYFDSQGVSAERDVDMYRLAMLEDTSKRVNLFQYKPAPESVSDSPSSNFTGPASIGNLILILRWCREHSQHPETITKRTSLELKGIANLASIILGNEIGIHIELDSPRFTPEQEKRLSIFNFSLSLMRKLSFKALIWQHRLVRPILKNHYKVSSMIKFGATFSFS